MPEPASPQPPYSMIEPREMETPLEAAAQREAHQDRAGAQARRDEQEADRLVADIDAYVAQTDPASLTEAEAALNAWEIPTDLLEGVPSNIAVEPNVEGEPLVSIFAAQTESEANIVRGLLESYGIPAVLNSRAGSALGGIFQHDETRWGDILVSSSQAEAAQAAIAEAMQQTAATQATEAVQDTEAREAL